MSHSGSSGSLRTLRLRGGQRGARLLGGVPMRKRSLVVLVSVLAMTFMLLAPGVAAADGGTGGPYYLAIGQAQEAYVRAGRVLQDSDFTEDFRPRPGDQLFFGETLYHSNANGRKGTRAGRTTIKCLVGVRQTFFCDGTMVLRGQGELYLVTSTSGDDRFLAAIAGGTRDFKAARGDVVISSVPRNRNRNLYQLRLR